LNKLGVHKICRSSVVNILRRHGLDPRPRHGAETWDEFISRHAQTLWACEFFTKAVWTPKGLVDIYLLFFIHIGSRRACLAGLTPNPDRAWVLQQARNFPLHAADLPIKPTMLLRDNDQKFGPEFDATLEAEGVEVKKVGPLAPNLNAYAERWVQSVGQECLDRFIVFGQEYLRYIINEYIAQQNTERPHQSLGNVPLTGHPPPELAPLDPRDVVCEERLGGLLKHYSRRAA
jgi:putative transposase